MEKRLLVVPEIARQASMSNDYPRDIFLSYPNTHLNIQIHIFKNGFKMEFNY